MWRGYRRRLVGVRMSMINEFVEKLINRLEEELKTAREMQTTQCIGHDGYGTPLQSKLGGEICALLKVQNIVNQLAEECKDVPDTNVGKWIPVSEKLPDDFMSYEYLTIRKGQTLATITYYCVVNHKWYSNRKSTKEIDVVAWQPLPSYKGE